MLFIDQGQLKVGPVSWVEAMYMTMAAMSEEGGEPREDRDEFRRIV